MILTLNNFYPYKLTTFSPLFCLIDNNKQGCSFIKYGWVYSQDVPWLDVWSTSDIFLLKPSEIYKYINIIY